MLSEEEKKAIEILKEIKDVRGIRQDVEGENEDLWALDIVYNLIEKQEKEIDRLQNIKRKDIEDLINKEKVNVYINYINKDKIRQKIKTLNEVNKNANEVEAIFNIKQLQILNELLEENTNE